MRTTITLDPDVEALVNKRMRERGIGFKEAVNSALRDALGTSPNRRRIRTRAVNMGEPTIDLTHALRVAGALEDAEMIRKMQLGK